MAHAKAPRRHRRFKLGGPAPDSAGGAGQPLQEALAELVLLRAENARLSAAVHEPPNIGRLVTRLRSVGRAADGDEGGDEVAQMLVDGIVLRESLLEVCRELERTIAAVKTRLDAFGGEDLSGSPAGGDRTIAAVKARRAAVDVSGSPGGG